MSYVWNYIDLKSQMFGIYNWVLLIFVFKDTFLLLFKLLKYYQFLKYLHLKLFNSCHFQMGSFKHLKISSYADLNFLA